MFLLLFPYRRDCEVMAGALVRANIAALAYHAGLKDDQRSMVQQRWVLEDRCKVRQMNWNILANGMC